jgi:hypothetical protein
MSMKPPSGLAASSSANDSDPEDNSVDQEDLSDQIEVDASDDVTVEAAEEVTTEAATNTSVAPDPTPPPSSGFGQSGVAGDASPQPILPSFFGSFTPGPSLPLPGVTAAPSEELRDIGDDITTLARGLNEDITRPAVTDDDEEETKVEPAEREAARNAARTDDVAAALSEQASVEREKALRKSGPNASLFGESARAASRGNDVEFSDPEDEDDAAIISADPVSVVSADAIDDDDDDDQIAAAADDDDIPDDEVVSADPDDDDELPEISPEERMRLVARKAASLVDDGDEDAETFSKSPEPSPLVAALTARRPGSPPMGSPFPRGDGFGTRLPSPSGGFASLALQAPAAAPAPASSPFGRLAPVAAGSPYSTRGSAAGMPALQIPAPSGAAASSAESTGLLFRPITLPLGGWMTMVGGALVLGLVIGGTFIGGRGQAPPVTVISSRPATTPIAPPVVQPVSPTTAPVAPPASTGIIVEPTTPSGPPRATGAPTTPPPSTASAPPPLGGPEFGEPAPKAIKRLLPPKPRRPSLTLPDDPTAAPKPAKPKPGKPAKAWVDPFAQ